MEEPRLFGFISLNFLPLLTSVGRLGRGRSGVWLKKEFTCFSHLSGRSCVLFSCLGKVEEDGEQEPVSGALDQHRWRCPFLGNPGSLRPAFSVPNADMPEHLICFVSILKQTLCNI